MHKLIDGLGDMYDLYQFNNWVISVYDNGPFEIVQFIDEEDAINYFDAHMSLEETEWYRKQSNLTIKRKQNG